MADTSSDSQSVVCDSSNQSPLGASEKISHKNFNFKMNKNVVRIIAGVGILAIVSLSALGLSGKTPSGIYVDGQAIAYVKDAALAENAIKEYIKDYSDLVDNEVFIAERVEILPVDGKENIDFCENTEEIKVSLENNITPVVHGAEIVINGDSAIGLASVDDANRVLQDLKNESVKNYGHCTVVDVKFRENVQVKDNIIVANQLMKNDEAVDYLMNHKEVEGQTYTIESGDTLWGAAKELNISLAALQEANPEINPDKLRDGEELVVTKEVPLLTTVAVLEKTEENVIPFSTKYKTDRSLSAGTSKVAQKGVNGKEKVDLQIVFENGKEVSRTRLNTEVITPAVDKVVATSPAVGVASRNVVSSGVLMWPTQAKRISSYYGNRSRGFHTGLDIDGNMKDPIWAADDGKVVFAGWKGNYGYLVKIDHGNGMQTWYAHCSKLLVKAGDTVKRGENIALMGSTGNSTGSHLHIEVRINGVHKNPLSYLAR